MRSRVDGPTCLPARGRTRWTARWTAQWGARQQAWACSWGGGGGSGSFTLGNTTIDVKANAQVNVQGALVKIN